VLLTPVHTRADLAVKTPRLGLRGSRESLFDDLALDGLLARTRPTTRFSVDLHDR
jgi:hypothetical protein